MKSQGPATAAATDIRFFVKSIKRPTEENLLYNMLWLEFSILFIYIYLLLIVLISFTFFSVKTWIEFLHLMCALMEFFLQLIAPSAFNFVKKMLTTAQIFCNQFGNSRFYCGIIKNYMAKMIDDFDFYNFFQTLIHIKVKCMCKRPTSKICPLFP